MAVCTIHNHFVHMFQCNVVSRSKDNLIQGTVFGSPKVSFELEVHCISYVICSLVIFFVLGILAKHATEVDNSSLAHLPK